MLTVQLRDNIRLKLDKGELVDVTPTCYKVTDDQHVYVIERKNVLFITEDK